MLNCLGAWVPVVNFFEIVYAKKIRVFFKIQVGFGKPRSKRP
jgi:hypothetical protein